MDPGSFKWKDQEGDGAGHFGHHAPEGFRGLMHRPPDVDPETDVPAYQADK
jgi:hypothetical protein